MVALSPVALSLTREFNDPKLQLIAQDVSNFAPGAHTGQTTIEQLKDLGVSASLVGHSERRKECGEDDEIVVKKTIHSLRSDLEVFFCFGEDLSEREAGRTKEVLTRQILPLLQALREEGLTLEKLIFAYEPV